MMQRHELRSRKEALDNSGMTAERSRYVVKERYVSFPLHLLTVFSQMLSLYANITRIKWDYDAACKGCALRALTHHASVFLSNTACAALWCLLSPLLPSTLR